VTLAKAWRNEPNLSSDPEAFHVATAAPFAHDDFLSYFVNEMCAVESDEKVPVEAVGFVQTLVRGTGRRTRSWRTFIRKMEAWGFVRPQFTTKWKGIPGIRLRGTRRTHANLREEDPGITESTATGDFVGRRSDDSRQGRP
jgi:hypothetical protein